MMKKRLLATLTAGFILVTAAWASAAPGMGTGMGPGGGHPCLFNSAAWTDEQKADFQKDMLEHREKMLELKKEFLNQEVEKGLITREQADQHLKFMQERLEWEKAHPGEMRKGPHHRGMMPGGPHGGQPCPPPCAPAAENPNP